MWVLDIPAAESDQYFKLLAAQSFYNTERPGTGAAQLTVTINGSQVHKPWEQVPQLDALAQRVRRDGRLVAYSRPAAQAGMAEGSIASLEVYRNMLAQTGFARGDRRGNRQPGGQSVLDAARGNPAVFAAAARGGRGAGWSAAAVVLMIASRVPAPKKRRSHAARPGMICAAWRLNLPGLGVSC